MREVQPPAFFGFVRNANADGTSDVYVPGARDRFGNEVLAEGLRSTFGSQPLAGQPVAGSWLSGPLQRGQHFLFGDPAGEAKAHTQSLLGNVLWPMHRHDVQRTGIASLGATQPFVSAGATLNARNTYFLRASGFFVVQAGPDGTWITARAPLDTGLTDITRSAVVMRQLVYDQGRDRLYGLHGDYISSWDPSTFAAHPTEFDASPLSSTSFSGITLEPLITTPAIWIVISSDWASWVWRALDPDDLPTTRETHTMAWDGWRLATGLPHSTPGVSYPIFLTTLPLYSHEASVSPLTQPMVTDAGFVIAPGDDGDFVTRVRDEREDPHSYEDQPAPRNYGLLPERSQVICYDPTGDRRIWTFDGWHESGKYSGFTAVVVVPPGTGNDAAIVHWERETFQPVTFRHCVGQAGIRGYVDAWGTPLAINSDHSVTVPPLGDLQANRTFTFLSYTDIGGTFLPWPYDVPAPTWSYNRSEVDALVTELFSYIQPVFSAAITRDVQTTLEHGMKTLDAVTGRELASCSMGATATYTNDQDTGDPNYIGHNGGTLESPRRMWTGDLRSLVVTLTGHSDTTLHHRAGLADDEVLMGYVAVEKWQDAHPWTGVDGFSHDTFYQGYIAWGGQEGEDTWAEPGPVWVSTSDEANGGRWAHQTIEVEYHMWIAKRMSVSLTYADPYYGWDPFNARTDGTRYFLLPRVGLPTRTPLVQTAYYPPGTTFVDDGVYNFQTHFGVGFPDDHFYSAGWYRGPIINGSFQERQIIDHNPLHGSLADTDRFTHHDHDHPWNTRGLDGGSPDLPARTPQPIGGASMYAPDAKFVFKHASPFTDLGDEDGHIPVAGTLEGRILNGNSTGYVWEIEIPAYGYWYDPLPGSTDALDPNNYRPVAYDSRGTGYKGRRGDMPSGGTYRYPVPPPDTHTPPSLPEQDNPHLNATLLCMDPATQAELWRREYGNKKLLVPPVVIFADDALFIWMPGIVEKIDRASGTVLAHIDLSSTAAWTHCDMIAIDGRLVIAGDTGRFDIAA